MNEITFLIAGILIGSVLAWLGTYLFFSRKSSRLEGKLASAEAINNELRQQVEKLNKDLSDLQEEYNNESQLRAAIEAKYIEAQKNFETIEKELMDKFNSLSLEALSRNSQEFLKLAEERLKAQSMEGAKELEGKKNLIDQSLKELEKTMMDIRQKIEEVSRGTVKVSTLIEDHGKVTQSLRETTEHIRQALASSRKRGEWGERMAEDIIRLVGLIEGINYIKQKTIDGSTTRPDYTFFMPNNLKINMDVKFPLDNYINYINAENEHERKRYRDELIRNTRMMIKQISSRDYINPSDNTVDYVLMFIPNEQVYSFIHEAEPSIMDEALKHKVILCSPFTLYAVLSVIRQAVENFNLERTASEMLRLFGEFTKQWNAYKERFKIMGERLDAAKREYEALLTTRSNMLEKPLRKIEELRREKQEILQIENTGKDK